MSGGRLGGRASPYAGKGVWSLAEASDRIRLGLLTRSYDAEVAADSPIARWRLDETSGTTASDSIGSNNGTYAGATLDQAPLINSGRSILLSGSGSGITIPDASNLSFPSGSFSLEVWFATSGTSAAAFIIKDTSGSIFGEYELVINSSGNIYCTVRPGNSGSPNVTATAGNTFNDGARHHVVAVFVPNTTLKLYVDGVVCASATHSIASSFDSTSSLRLGRSGGGNYLAGNLDEVALYASALSADRVLAHYNAGL